VANKGAPVKRFRTLQEVEKADKEQLARWYRFLPSGHGSHFGTLPNVTALVSENFRGTTAQRISFMDNLLAKVVFRGQTRFLHKLHALKKIIEKLQKETRVIVEDVSDGEPVFPDRAWRELEVLGYDLNTCMGETTVVLKSFFCALPAEELETFRQRLMMQVPTILTVSPRRT
jgi:hypothetical protein